MAAAMLSFSNSGRRAIDHDSLHPGLASPPQSLHRPPGDALLRMDLFPAFPVPSFAVPVLLAARRHRFGRHRQLW